MTKEPGKTIDPATSLPSMKGKSLMSTKTTLTTAVRQGISTSTDSSLLESSLFKGILEREKQAAADEIALLNGQIDQLTFRANDLRKIVESADAAMERLDIVNTTEGVEYMP